MMKKILSVMLAGIMALSMFTACGNNNDASGEVKEDKTLVVGLDTAFPPMGFLDENQNIVGFDIDLAKAVGEKLGMEVKLQPIDWDQKFIELDNGNVDVLWNGLTITDERKAKCEITKPYLANKQVIVVNADSAIKKKVDLADKTIGAQSDSSALDAIKDDDFVSKLKLQELGDNVSLLNDLKAGNIDAVVMDLVVAEYMLSKDEGKYRILEDTLAPEEYGIAAKKGNTELVAKIEGAINELIESGEAAKISEKWFGADKIIK